MKRIIASLTMFTVLVSLYSCNDDENIPTKNQDDTTGQIVKLMLDGIGVRDSLSFTYDKDKVRSIAWCTSLNDNDCALEYSETRLYSENGTLASLDGRWQVSYEYEDGLRKSIVASYNNQYYSTTTFLDYDNNRPSRLRENEISETRYVDLLFNDSGDLIRKKVSDENDVLLEDVNITYADLENPLRGVLETPSYAVVVFGFDDFVFYFSKHFPARVDFAYSQQNPVAPKSFVIDYETTLDESGKVVSANAFRVSPGQHINAHSFHIDYD